MIAKLPRLLTLLLLLSACTFDSTRRHYLEALGPHLPPPSRPVIIIPGFGVTRLFDPVTARYVWGTPRTTVHTSYEDDLDLPIDDVTGETSVDRLIPRGFVGSRGPVNIGWQLSLALRKYARYRAAPDDTHDPAAVTLYPFYNDWRLSASSNAARLDSFIDEIRKDHGDASLQVDLIGHSAGGLIVLTYLTLGTASVEEAPRWSEAARSAQSKVNRAVMIATPVRGTVDAFRILVEEERFLRRRFSFDLIGTLPSIGELLPFDGQFLVDEKGGRIDANLHSEGAWKRLQIGPYRPATRKELLERVGAERYARLLRAFRTSLDRAARWREAIRQAPRPRTPIFKIAGDCVLTPALVLMRADGGLAFYPSQLRPNESGLMSRLFEPGDGSVGRSSALGESEPGLLFCDGHQGIASDPNVHRALIRILTKN